MPHCAHIKNAVTGLEAEALVVDREHLDGFPRTDQRRVLGRDALGRRPPGEAIEDPTAASLGQGCPLVDSGPSRPRKKHGRIAEADGWVGWFMTADGAVRCAAGCR